MSIKKLFSGEGDEEFAAEHIAEFFGPGQVDRAVRQAIQVCWMALPKERKNTDDLEKEFRRIVDRAFKDFRDDSAAFDRST